MYSEPVIIVKQSLQDDTSQDPSAYSFPIHSVGLFCQNEHYPLFNLDFKTWSTVFRWTDKTF